MPQELPIEPSNPWQEINVDIRAADGSSAPYIFEFKWNTRDSYWYVNISDGNRVPIVTGAKVVIGTYLGRRSLHPLMDQGVFLVVDTSSRSVTRARDAGLDDLGARVVIRYYTVIELLATKGAFS